jgi:hypothetical protein
LGAVFDMAQPVANPWIHRLHPCLTQALATVKSRTARTVDALGVADDAVKRFLPDGTERPIQRSMEQAEQERFSSGKKKRHTVKNNVLVNAHGAIVLLTATCEGKKHDKKVTDEAAFTLPAGSVL